jgi:hypothetical protein
MVADVPTIRDQVNDRMSEQFQKTLWRQVNNFLDGKIGIGKHGRITALPSD